MEFLYVCEFSNGHIKVGRSEEPDARIQQHRERVACMGVTLLSAHAFACGSQSSAREAWLITRCTTYASERHLNEWFVGLGPHEVRAWAAEAAGADIPEVFQCNAFGQRLQAARACASLTQEQLGRGLAVDGTDLQKAAVSAWETGRSSPNAMQLRLICERLSASADRLLGLVA